MNESSEINNEKRKHRKRPLLLSARQYAKKGCFGRGSEIPGEKYRYFVHCLEIFRNGFPNDDEKSIFANNALHETENEELNYACNQIGCRVIEELLPSANFPAINRFIKAFSSDLRSLSTDRFASHVLQALVDICCQKSRTEGDEDRKTQYREFTLKVSKFLLNNLEDFVNDTYANNVIRTVLKNLSNLKELDKDKIDESNVEVPEEYAEIVTEYATRLMSWPQFIEFPYEELTSGLLQILLQALRNVNTKLLKKMQRKLLNESFADMAKEIDNLPYVYQSKSAVNLLETCILVASPKSYTKIHAKCFIGLIPTLATMKISNFAVQKLITQCKDKEQFGAIFAEMASSFEEILTCRYTGILLSIAQTCKKLVVNQGNFIQLLMKALHCDEPDERQNKFITAVATLLPFEQINTDQKSFYVNVHGSLILQFMLEFNKPIKIVNWILNMEVDDLKNLLFCDKKGSHVIDTYMKSQYVGEKSREKLIKKMQGTYQELASSKFGSRSLETLWNAAQPSLQSQIMNELAYKGGSWSNTQFGRIIWSKFNVECYKKDKAKWKQTVGKPDKTQNLFADILEK